MANITELQLQGSSTVYKLNDARITTTAVDTATHILTMATNSGETSIAPITAANLASVMRGNAGNYALVVTGAVATDILTNCKAYYETMPYDTIAFVHMEAATTSFGYIIKGKMGSGVGLIKVMKGASGDVVCYKKLYNSSEWVESTF